MDIFAPLNFQIIQYWERYARMKSFGEKIRFVTAIDLIIYTINRSNYRYCSLRAYLFLSYHLILVPWSEARRGGPQEYLPIESWLNPIHRWVYNFQSRRVLSSSQDIPCYLYYMVSQIMLRTHEEKQVFTEKKSELWLISI